jgi:hypothetical protein
MARSLYIIIVFIGPVMFVPFMFTGGERGSV